MGTTLGSFIARRFFAIATSCIYRKSGESKAHARKPGLHTSIRVHAKSGPKGLSEEGWLICNRACISQVKPSLHLLQDFRSLLKMMPPFGLSLKTYTHNICNSGLSEAKDWHDLCVRSVATAQIVTRAIIRLKQLLDFLFCSSSNLQQKSL